MLIAQNLQESYCDLLGLPYKLGASGEAFDCWSLVVEVLKRCGADVDYLPDYDASHVEQMREYKGRWKEYQTPAAGCVVLMTSGKRLHCGIMLDNSNVLHCAINSGVSVVRLYNLKQQYKEMRFYTYV